MRSRGRVGYELHDGDSYSLKTSTNQTSHVSTLQAPLAKHPRVGHRTWLAVGEFG